VIVLAVHSSTPSLGVAVTQNGRVLGETILVSNHEHLEKLATVIRELMAHLGLNLREIDGFGVAIGPGSFSGIRVGLATVKGLALALGKPVAGISSLEILAWAALESGESGLPVIDARRGQVYSACYEKDGMNLGLVEGPLLLTVDQFFVRARLLLNSIPICEDIDSSMPTQFSNLRNRQVNVSRPVACALIAENRFKLGVPDNLHLLAPLYVRRSDAEEKRSSYTDENR
jgi:tRNA threonylcarbamoyladenosine biosynthesis protein TsaB